MEEKKEMVNSPSHYNQGNIEAIDAMVSAFGEYSTAEFCKINAFKYLWRLGLKDDEAQEIGKIKWYLDKYLELKTLVESHINKSNNAWVNELSEEMDVWQRPALLKKGLTNREAESIINK